MSSTLSLNGTGYGVGYLTYHKYCSGPEIGIWIGPFTKQRPSIHEVHRLFDLVGCLTHNLESRYKGLARFPTMLSNALKRW